MWAGFTIKRLKEEQFMRQTFGAQYIDYAQTTGAIFPALLRRSS
jgi:protein-S-isoprenylcysteine O-methyltransferase Ste14